MVEAVFTPAERAFATAVNQIIHANPFVRDEVDRLERAALAIELAAGTEERGGVATPVEDRPNLSAIVRRSEGLCEIARERLPTRCDPSDTDVALFRDLVFFNLYFRFRFELQASISASLQEAGDEPAQPQRRTHGLRMTYFDRFTEEAERLLGATGWLATPTYSVAHRFALCFQIRRAFHFIHVKIRGRSRAIDRLRAAVWQSIFTHDMRRYDQHLHERMHDITTLITGQSGTGKDLVAEAIGQSRYIRFDTARKAFTQDVAGAFHPVNLSAIPSGLVEAELFGNCKGAFTGALHDRVGWLELCGPFHSVFLDEIGELSQDIQVKLLRVLQNRTFQRVGETKGRSFEGKVIAATNRDLDDEMRAGRFRRDFYYRLCSDRIRTPTLREQLDDNPSELAYFAEIIARRFCGDAAAALSKEVVAWIEQNLPGNYAWPGNFRELEQCVRNILVRNEYHPPRDAGPETMRLADLQLTADELVSWYCTLVFSQTRSYAETSRRLKLDRRTVKRRVKESEDET